LANTLQPGSDKAINVLHALNHVLPTPLIIHGVETVATTNSPETKGSPLHLGPTCMIQLLVPESLSIFLIQQKDKHRLYHTHTGKGRTTRYRDSLAWGDEISLEFKGKKASTKQSIQGQERGSTTSGLLSPFMVRSYCPSESKGTGGVGLKSGGPYPSYILLVCKREMIILQGLL
jgi:hypothetical protein